MRQQLRLQHGRKGAGECRPTWQVLRKCCHHRLLGRVELTANRLSRCSWSSGSVSWWGDTVHCSSAAAVRSDTPARDGSRAGFDLHQQHQPRLMTADWKQDTL